MTPKLFSELGISAEVQKAIVKLGFEQAAPIQAEAIPPLLAGKDLVGQSMTGSGKTAAFAIPAIEKTDPAIRAIQVLILCPTRELAVQVSEEVHKLAFFKRGIHALPIYGGQSYERQYQGLRNGAQIIIGTPGRLMDHMRRGTIRLDQVKMVILDEADVMLDMGFRDDIEFILQAVPTTRQTVFFSATMPRIIRDLIAKYARDPQNVSIDQKALTVPTVDQVYYEVDRRFKIELLTRLIDIHDLKLGIIFCNTKAMVDDLVDHLNAQGYSADRLHGDMNQAMRDRVMGKFRKSGLEFLVATDVAARGIDVDDVEVVFNYDLPYDVQDYVHRIGRTGRAGRDGKAISFVAGREVFQIYNIERYTKVKIKRGKVPTPAEVEEARNNVFLEKIRATLKGGEFKKQDHFIERLLEEGFTSTDIASALLHQLQSGEASSAKQPPREEAPARSERPSFRDDRSDRGDRGGRYDRPDGPPQRDNFRPDFRDERPPARLRPAFNGPAIPPRPAAAMKPKTSPAAAPVAVAGAPGTLPASAAKPAPTPAPVAAPFSKPRSVTPAAAPAPSSVTPAVRPTPSPAAPAPPPPTPSPENSPAASAPAPTAASGPLSSADRPPRPERPQRPFERKRAEEFRPGAPRKPASRSTPPEQTRLFMSVGEQMGVTPGDVVGAILGETGLPASTVGVVDIRDRHLFVDVASEHANSIITKLNRSNIKGNRLKVKIA
ncbi:hypothetical protein LBMAG56_46160 [Verrucomicrobiota bacterium]|nr:hypothetical protein LBMAG56_46160 [Verrucomicrobiota bacterium]